MQSYQAQKHTLTLTHTNTHTLTLQVAEGEVSGRGFQQFSGNEERSSATHTRVPHATPRECGVCVCVVCVCVCACVCVYFDCGQEIGYSLIMAISTLIVCILTHI